MSKFTRLLFNLIIIFLLGSLVSLSFTPVFATKVPPKVNWVKGEKFIMMGDNLATMDLPKGYRFANAEDTSKLMEYFGNPISSQDIGLVMSNNIRKNWVIVFSFYSLGYVKDDESGSIDKDTILERIKTATEEDNKKRQSKGIPKLTVSGWQEPPYYDPTSHNLVWAISATQSQSENRFVNYNTRKLGRDGVTSIMLITSPVELSILKPELDKLVASYDYVAGKKYTDFIEGKDKAAEIGLSALIVGGTGVAAVKAGILTKVLLFLAIAFKKVWIFLVIGVGGFIGKLFVSKKSQDTDN